MSSPLVAVLFDFDGTLVDSDAAQRMCFNQVLAKHGREMSEVAYAEVAGWSTVSIFNALFPNGSQEFLTELSDSKEAALLANHGLVVLQPRAIETLSALSHGGLRLALVTSASRIVVEPILERLGVAKFFETCVCHEDVTQKKPHPQPYQLALARLGVSPIEAIAIEDSDVGRRSAETAGIEVIVYKPTPEMPEDDLLKNRIANLDELLVRLSPRGQ